MALDEQTRHAMHLRLDELVGNELAAAMMTAYDRPIAWHELATKQDLESVRADLEILEHRLTAALHEGLDSQTKTLVISTIGSIAVMLGAAVAISNLLG